VEPKAHLSIGNGAVDESLPGWLEQSLPWSIPRWRSLAAWGGSPPIASIYPLGYHREHSPP